MGKQADMIKGLLSNAGEIVAEALWPTRCAVCDELGAVLCPECAQAMPYVDWWRACPRCGAPYGKVQCSECNPVTLAHIRRDELPYAGCASATMFDDVSGKVVRVYKDQGEQRLAQTMAAMMCLATPPSWHADAVTFVPASARAVRTRGFDHAELLARAVADYVELPCVSLLERPRSIDQRKLGRRQRVENMGEQFSTLVGASLPERLILVDDVYTTGSTLCGATDALMAAGCNAVYGLTFARVM